MERAKNLFVAGCIAGIILVLLAARGESVAAQAPSRAITVMVPYTEHEWWLIRFATNETLCQVFVDHAGLPTLAEVSADCGADLANAWWVTPPCNLDEPIQDCEGLYVFLYTTTPKEKETIVQLPAPTVWVTLEGCSPSPPENLCSELPFLVLSGEEPLPNERIVAIQGIYDGTPFYCQGEFCRLPLSTTSINGITVEFWADSSYGDSSERLSAHVRVLDSGVSAAPGGGGWYVDVISSQWTGEEQVSCAKIWEAFPPAGEPPVWLSTPDHYEVMASGEPYFYLAGRLISQGVVDASVCPNNGLLPNGYADACGLETARPMVEDWQNQFDNRIIETAKETGVPAQIMKNLFAQESQFWPGMYRVLYEYGLGQITDAGTDAIFMWNPAFFDSFCPLVLSPDACAGGYLSLTDNSRGILRGYLALQAYGDCPDCTAGIDLTNTGFTVSLFAHTLQANCAQVARSVYNATEEMAGRVATYEDLWRLTIANYHAGPGCTSFAIHQAWGVSQSLEWEVVRSRFTEACMGVVPYVETITR